MQKKHLWGLGGLIVGVFGGEDFRTAYITVSGTGRLLSMPWKCAGAKLNYLNV